MTTKDQIIAILQNYSYSQELQSGDMANVIDEDDFETIANMILNVCENCEDVNFCTIENCCLKDVRQ
jgi:hypothetical protein